MISGGQPEPDTLVGRFGRNPEPVVDAIHVAAVVTSTFTGLMSYV